MTSTPMLRCQVCGDCEVVRHDESPMKAEHRLANRCTAKGHTSEPKVRSTPGWDAR